MKKRKMFCWAMIVMTAILGIYVAVGAQEPKAIVPKPETAITLSPEASKRWNDLNAAEQEFFRQAQQTLAMYEARKTDVLIGAGVPADLRPNCAGDPVVCRAPQPAPSPK